MKVILLKDIGGVGQKGTVQNVADGYALNNLIPRKMAQLATPEVLRNHDRQAAEDKAERAAQEKEWAAIVARMKNFTLMVRANADQKGHLYKKVSAEDVARILKEQGIDVPADAITPKMPIKQSGAWPVEIELGSHKATITVDVVAA